MFNGYCFCFRANNAIAASDIARPHRYITAKCQPASVWSRRTAARSSVQQRPNVASFDRCSLSRCGNITHTHTRSAPFEQPSVIQGRPKAPLATQNASRKFSGDKNKEVKGKCCKTHLQASLIPKFFRGDTSGPQLKRGVREGEGEGRERKERGSRRGCRRRGWVPLLWSFMLTFVVA